jgi:maltose alpha-D-glucosyltransferase/alpha-amylase
MADADPLWFKDAVIYQLHVKAFYDATNDGVGDFQGLTEKLDYLQDLGVTALWLLPFYPSPLRDDGYDIADYRNVNPTYGTMGDFRTFVREAHRRGLKVITELVVNHTSDQHPWFQRARRAKPGSRLRDFYVWSDTDQKFQGTRIIFIDTEKSNWAWDPVAQAYYWHRFYSHQPDLNFDNPRVFRAVSNVMKFWLDIGVDGMRLDAVPYLVEREGTNNENLPETHEVLKRLRADLDRTYGDRMLLAEANQWPEDTAHYFGEGDECHMAFHFPLMPRIYMAVANEDRHPITDIMRQTPEIPSNCQWAVFLRNHDELTLEMVTDRERDYLWNFYAADRRARINLGIRRRLAPLMENDRRKIELLNSLIFSMPGTPILYYGDEIGMGDNVFLGDRDGVRTPMQWTPDRNGGFSRADPAQLYLPPIMDPVYGYQAVNVEAQQRSPSSLLNWMKRIIAVRQARRAFGRGTLRFLYPSNRKVLVYLRAFEDERILCVVNLSRSPQSVELDLAEFRGAYPRELFGRTLFSPIGERSYMVTLQGHSFLWFLLEAQPAEEEVPPTLPELVTLILRSRWSDLLDRHNRPQLERDILPAFLRNQRWFQGKDRQIRTTRVEAAAEFGSINDGSLLAVIAAELSDGSVQRYFLPMAALWEEFGERRTALLPLTIASLRQFRRSGALIDAIADDDFGRAVVTAMRNERRLPSEAGEIRFERTPSFERQPIPENLVQRRLGGEQSNTSILLEEYGVLKLYRRLAAGISPEIEMSRYLTETAGFANTPPLLGLIEVAGAEPMPLGVLFAFIRNQGEAWSATLDYLRRFLEEALLVPLEQRAIADATQPVTPDRFYFTLARQMGIRTAEMHRALCPETGASPGFAPEPITASDLDRWRDGARRSAETVLAKLGDRMAELAETARPLAERLLGEADRLRARIDALLPAGIEGVKTRFHGDYHLGQVLVVQNDVYIIDFEGEPLRSLDERRQKSSPLRDVAGMLRSFHYAAETALREMSELRPAAHETLRGSADYWRRAVVENFLGGYLVTMSGCPSVPADERARQDLLDFFTLDKALYEVTYELANRPGWVAIPLAGVLDLVSPSSPPPSRNEPQNGRQD